MQFHLYFFLAILICLSSKYSFVEIKRELQRNILKFGYGINYKYKYDEDDDQIKQNIKDLLFYCSKVRPYMALYRMQISVYNLTAHKILKNEVHLILPKFQKNVEIREEFWSNNFRIFRFSF